MHRTFIACSLAVAAAAALPAAAQYGQGQVVSQPGLVGMAQTINVTATIKAIDQQSREVTLVGPEGREVTVAAGPEVKKYVSFGAGPRASQDLVLGAKARAAMDGRPVPDIDDVRGVALSVLRHRVVMNFQGEAEGVRVEKLLPLNEKR